MPRLIHGAIVIVAAVCVTWAWFNMALTVPASEALWSFYNQLLDGRMPGVASDLEFATVMLGAAVVASLVIRMASRGR